MQAVFILGFFATVYAIVLAFTISLSQSAMQQKIQRIEDTKQIFSDVEYAINKGVLAEGPDAELVNCDTDKFIFAQPYVKWRREDLIKDPWGVDFYCYSFVMPTTLYADTTSNVVIAPVRVFALVSAGPNRVSEIETGGGAPVDFSSASTLEAPAYSDDIVYVFSTYDQMADMWTMVKEKVDKAKAIALEDYQQQLRAYQPFIDQYFEDNGADLLEEFSDTDIVSRKWVEDLHPETGGAGFMLDGQSSDEGYPRISTDLEFSADFKDMPPIVASSLNVDVDNNLYQGTLSVDPLAGSEWTITYSLDLDALEGI